MKGVGTKPSPFFYVYIICESYINMMTIENFLGQIDLIVTKLGYECVHASIKTEFGRLKVQVLIDTLGGINAGDCELVSGHVNKFLDENQDLPFLNNGRYYLEVSSPGIERPLYKIADYVRFQGREARVRLNELLDGRKTFTGEILRSADDSQVIMLCDGHDIHIPFEIIKGGNLIFRFDDEKDNHKPTKTRNRRTKK